MARIIFLTDIDEGHIYPTLGFAKSLEQRGHNIYYLGISDVKQPIENNNFSFFAIFQDIYPKGFILEYKKLQKENPKDLIKKINRPHLQLLIKGELDNLLKEIKPDLIIINYVLSIEALLIKHKYQYKLAFFTSWLRKPELKPSNVSRDVFNNLIEDQKISLANFFKCNLNLTPSLFGALDSIPELIPCIKDLDVDSVYDTSVLHIEAAIEHRLSGTEFINNLNIKKGDKIIYVSLGSQTSLYSEWLEEFYNRFINLMSEEFNSGWHLIMSISKEINIDNFGLLKNVTLSNWLPQTEVLNIVDVAVIHGGLGTVKECICKMIPMVVFPMANDQFDNAERVQFNNLGVKADHKDILKLNLHKIITDLVTNNEIKKGLKYMKKKMIQTERNRPGINFIEKYIRANDGLSSLTRI